MQSLVIAAACSYTPNVLKPFLSSLKECSPDTKVALLVNPSDQKYKTEILNINHQTQLFNVTDYPLRKFIWGTYRGSGKVRKLAVWGNNLLKDFHGLSQNKYFEPFVTSILHIGSYRFHMALELIVKHYKEAELILLTDTRDVYFQDNPFSDFNAEILSGLEDLSVAECECSSMWVKDIYGSNGLEKIGRERLICAGVTIGKRQNIMNYLKLMCKELSTNASKIPFVFGHDQGVHNWIIRHNPELNFTFSPNGSRYIATLNYSDMSDFSFDEQNGLMSNNEPVCIVHQYDSKQYLSEWVEKKWSKDW